MQSVEPNYQSSDTSDSEKKKSKKEIQKEEVKKVLEKLPSMEQETEEIDIMGMLKKKKMYIIEKDF